MKITKKQLRRIIKEELKGLTEGNLESSMYDRRAKEQGYDALGSAKRRASDFKAGRDILQQGIDEIEEIAIANAVRGEDQSGYEKILDIVHRVSMSYETDED
jgi:hypothetical protein